MSSAFKILGPALLSACGNTSADRRRHIARTGVSPRELLPPSSARAAPLAWSASYRGNVGARFAVCIFDGVGSLPSLRAPSAC